MVVKKTPCEGCRNQKRKCNGNNPCQRCGKLNLTCVYLKNSAPDDFEYIQLAREAALNEQVAFLEDQLDELGAAVEDMKKQQQQQQQQQQQYSLSIDIATPALSYDDTDLSSVDSNDHQIPVVRSTEIVRRGGSSSSSVSAPPVWTLEVTKGGLSFETQVKTHTDLLVHAQNLAQVIQLNDIIPSGVQRNAHQGALMDTIGSRILYRSNKSRYKTALLSIEYLVPWQKEEAGRSLATMTTMTVTTVPLIPTFTTTMSLLSSYIKCQHLYLCAIHIPTFERLFVLPSITSYSSDSVSPALYAFCAVVCTMDCDHISKVVPTRYLSLYGQHYYEQARLSLADRFDEISLELVTAYVFMAVYQWYHLNESICNRYCDMAHRMAHLLLKTQLDNDDEVIHLYRIICYMLDVCAHQQTKSTDFAQPNTDFQQMVDELRKRLSPSSINNNQESTLLTTPLLISNEPAFLRYQFYRHDLKSMVHQALQMYDRYAVNMYEMIARLSYLLEKKVRQWHAALDPDYRISGLPLLETWAITDEDYTAKLVMECDTNIVSALMTLAIYEELMMIGLTSLPKSSPPPSDRLVISHLSQLWKGGDQLDVEATSILGVSNIDKWKRRIRKLCRLKEAIQFDGEDEDFVALIQTSFYSRFYQFELPFMIIVLEATFNAIRICQYLLQKRSQGMYCFFDKRIVCSAKSILNRFLVACEGHPSRWDPYLDSIYEKIVACDDMLGLVFGNEDVSWLDSTLVV
ncbi:hypothetical protein BC941DRAFT_410750 [Chlamydoabsidia padenii]|nr:hypothetical protein BC941DRAFT_410750 [Chlamydoabsidia padenii]